MNEAEKARLMKELLRIECALSPENLTCDGELSQSQVRRRGAELHRQRRIVVSQLGYVPTEKEIWNIK